MSTSRDKSSNAPLFRWEQGNHGLDHHCGVCHTQLAGPKAKNSCFGKHVEPCCKFHNTLFFIGQSHNCEACRKSEELHTKRLRDIQQRIRVLEAAKSSPTLPPSTNSRKRSASKLTPLPSPDSASGDDSASPTPSEEIAPTKRTRTSTGAVVPTGTKKERKALKSAAKHTTRVSVVTSVDLARLNAILHPTRTTPGSGQDGLANAAIKPNLGRIKTPKRVTRQSARQAESADEQMLDGILAALGVKAESKEGKEQVRGLRAKIAEHLAITRKEVEMTMQRRDGYRRYVSRKTYECIVRKGEFTGGEGSGGEESVEESVEESAEESVEEIAEESAKGSSVVEVTEEAAAA